MNYSLGKRIMLARREMDLLQDDLAKRMDVSMGTIINWEVDRFSPDNYSIKRLAEILKKPFEYFLPDDPTEKSNVDLASVKPTTTDNMMTLPVLARIPAGLPDYSVADVESYASIPRYLFPGADFLIHCCGDSMEPDIHTGSLCVIRKEREAISGKVMLVQTEDGYTIKRIHRNGANIELHPANGNHKIIHPKELRIIGLVIGTWKKIE